MCQRRLELRGQDGNLDSAINVGLEVGVAFVVDRRRT